MKTYVAVSLLSLLIGAALSRAYFQKETIKTVEKVVTIDHVVTVTHTVHQKDGTDVTDTTTTDDKKADNNKVVVDVKPSKAPEWSARALVGISQSGTVYGAEVSKQLLGPVEVGVWGMTPGAIGVSIGVRF